ncbi:hypothetical protein MNVM_42050 [Mycobacterium novum]|uniref:Phosphatase n=1 Tax=Mycobacterium novum TaxID=2492438 RepID=A0A7I7JV54_9MYCO|nr:hypothetical protein MNVM_42050 [Mycobacterium novum]
MAPEVRRELSTLNRATADGVACHLVAAGMLLDDDPPAALRHARAARSRSTRITAVREAVGIAAYHCGDWAQALAELRAARRMGSKSALLPLIADCERGMGRPQRAIELAAGDEAAQLEGDEADELRIVVAGARADLGQLEQALTVLSTPAVDPDRTGSTVARLHYAHAETLVALGRESEAVEWFLRAAAADVDGVTDVEDRIAELGGSAALADEYDCLLLDLDGTVFRGGEPTVGAVETLAELPSRALFITNNSSRGADEVAAHLNRLGFTAAAEDVATSAQIAAHLLAEQLPAGSRVLVVGTESLAAEIAAAGLEPVRLASDEPAAVVQGSPPRPAGRSWPRRRWRSGRRHVDDHQRRQDTAVGTRPAARQRLDGGRVAGRDRRRTAGGRQTRSGAAHRGADPRRVLRAAGGR